MNLISSIINQQPLKKRMGSLNQWFVISILISFSILSAQTIDLQIEAKTTIKINLSNYNENEKVYLYRSTTNLQDIRCPNIHYPVSQYKFEPASEISFQDTLQADNTKYFYKVVLQTGSEMIQSEVDSLLIPDKTLPELINPHLLVDKPNYILELWNGDEKIKTYPLALGRNPSKRKLNQDNSSTPEGIYMIYNLQPNATFYKAFDIDYPNAADRARYQYYSQENLPPFDRINPAIGGEIQIHGCGINNNWTFGCMAMRDDDIDELFAAENIRAGMKAIIIGEQFKRDDIPFLLKSRKVNQCKILQSALQQKGYYPGTIDGLYGPQTGKALAKFQEDHDLVITCDFDEETVGRLIVE